MVEIIIDWSKIESQEDFYEIFLPQVKAPSWHGRNLDALADSIVTGDINEIEPPYTIRNMNYGSTVGDIAKFQLKVFSIFNEAIAASRNIEIVSE